MFNGLGEGDSSPRACVKNSLLDALAPLNYLSRWKGLLLNSFLQHLKISQKSNEKENPPDDLWTDLVFSKPCPSRW